MPALHASFAQPSLELQFPHPGSQSCCGDGHTSSDCGEGGIKVPEGDLWMLCGRASAHARGWITIIVECNEVYNNFVHLIRTNVLHLP